MSGLRIVPSMGQFHLCGLFRLLGRLLQLLGGQLPLLRDSLQTEWKLLRCQLQLDLTMFYLRHIQQPSGLSDLRCFLHCAEQQVCS